MTDDPLDAITYSLHDSLMVLAPGGWKEVELEVVPTPQGLKLAALSTRGEGSAVPQPLPDLGVQREHEAARLSEGLTELQHMLGHTGKTWHGGKARIERGKEHTDFKLLDGERVVWLSRMPRAERDQLLFTDELFDALLGTERAFAQLQSTLTVDASATLLELGTYDREEFVWRWNHASPDVRRVCAVDAKQAGLSALWRAGFAADEGFVWAVCGHVCVALGARGAYRVENARHEPIKLCAVLR